MFSSPITHFWGIVNPPSAGNISSEVNGDWSLNPERSLCHDSSRDATREESHFHYSRYQYALLSKSGEEWPHMSSYV